jgi:pimeloyl-ACP methyl ester carboxylesterase
VLFRPLVERLPPDIEPVVVTYPHDQPLGYDELLPLVLERLPTDRPFALLGESFSGPLAIRAAATRPANLRGVILCASFVRSPLAIRPRWLPTLIQPWMFVGFRRLSQMKALLGDRASPEVRAMLREALSTVQPAVLARRIQAVMQVDVSAELAACPVPILYLRADWDYVVPHRNAAEILAIQPAVRIVSIPASHLLMQTQPDQTIAAIREFLAEATR